MRQLINETRFKKTIKSIGKMTDLLANNIHEAGMFALQQVNEHGNANFARLLIEALGKKHRAEGVKAWLVHFGKLKYTKENGIVFRKRTDINETNLEAWLEKADAIPYWDFAPEPEAKYSVDYMTMLHAIINKHKTMQEKQKEGKEVEEKHLNVLDEVQKLLDKFTKKDQVKAELNIVPAISSIG